MIKLISLLLVLVPIIFAEQNSTSNSCSFTVGNSYYDLSTLEKADGVAWSAKDNNGVAWYFTFCDALGSFADHQVGCDPSSGVCIETIYGTFFNGGLPSNDWKQLDGQEDVITTTYIGGDACHNSKENFKLFKTQFILTCSDNDEMLTVTKVTYKDCETIIEGKTIAACPNRNNNNYSNNFGISMKIQPISAFFLSFFFTLAFCLCCITCCYRSRRNKFIKKSKDNKGKYTKLNTVTTQTTPETPQTTPNFPPPSYFAYLPSQQSNNNNNNFYYPQAPYFYGPQAPIYGNNDMIGMGYSGNATMVTPIVPLESQINDQIVEDERLARELQDQLNSQ